MYRETVTITVQVPKLPSPKTELWRVLLQLPREVRIRVEQNGSDHQNFDTLILEKELSYGGEDLVADVEKRKREAYDELYALWGNFWDSPSRVLVEQLSSIWRVLRACGEVLEEHAREIQALKDQRRKRQR